MHELRLVPRRVLRVAVVAVILGILGGAMTALPASAQPPATAILQPEGYLSTTPSFILRQFGVDVALDGDTVAVGAPRAQNADSRGGRVYILTRIGPSWIQEVVLTPPPAEPGDSTSLRFGYVLDISGDTIVVGSSGNALGYNGASGVLVYRRGGSGWQLEATLRADDAAATSGFGLDVAIDGDTILVGAPFAMHPAPAPRGSAYVFTRTGTTWTKQAELRVNDPDSHNLGFTLALDGDTAIIGSPVASGFAHVFTRTGDTWTEQARLAAPDGRNGDQFAINIALDGDTTVLGATRAAGIGSSSEGAAYVFVRTGGNWTFQEKLMAADAGTVTKTMTVPAAIRVNVAVAGDGSDVPELADESFGARIDATQPIVVERSMYHNANGAIWAAGTNATATPLPPP